jgi:hypothetical protein
MEDTDPRIVSAYKKYVLGQTEPEKTQQMQTFLDTFLVPIMVGERDPSQCSISLSDLARWTGKRKSHLKRMIDPEYARTDLASEPSFREGVDFCYLRSRDKYNRDRMELSMTVSTMKKVLSRLDTNLGSVVLDYLWLTEGALRDWTASIFREKLQRLSLSNEVDSDLKIINKIFIRPGVNLSKGIGYYAIMFPFKGTEYIYQGITDNITYRIWQHAVDLPIGCDVTLMEWTQNDDPEFIESCRRHFNKADRVPVPEALHGMKDLFYADEFHWNNATSYCQSIEQKGTTDWISRSNHLSDAPRMLASPDLYPVRQSKAYPRAKLHSWTCGPVARYTGRFPELVDFSKKASEKKRHQWF